MISCSSNEASYILFCILLLYVKTGYYILIGSLIGGAILGVPFLDPLAGLVVSGMILKAGIETGWER